MKELTVKQLAAISGVTVRMLHHYDEIGLLPPAHVGGNGYRYYGKPELLRLQRILFHRELGVPLAQIAGLLALEGQDQIGVLLAHREKLAAERERYGAPMEQAVEKSRKRYGALTEAAQAAVMAQYRDIEEALAEACRRGIDPASDVIASLVGRHRAWVATMWDRPASAEAYAGLADLYKEHPDFAARYEAIAPGFTDYLVKAMKMHAAKG